MQILTFSSSLQDMRIERSFLGIVFNLALKMYVHVLFNVQRIIHHQSLYQNKTKQYE